MNPMNFQKRVILLFQVKMKSRHCDVKTEVLFLTYLMTQPYLFYVQQAINQLSTSYGLIWTRSGHDTTLTS